jgi:hypothetical protein
MDKQLLILAFLVCLSGFRLWGQVEIKGKVIERGSPSGIALVGVTLVESGTLNGTLSAADGTFRLSVTDANARLTVSFVGFATQEIELKGETDLLIRLKPACTRCFLDGHRIGMYTSSGLLHTPVGGGLAVSFPAYMGQAKWEADLSYQTNLKENFLMNAQLGIYHLLVSCYFDADIISSYQRVGWGDEWASKKYAVEANLNFSGISLGYLQFILGYSAIDFTQPASAKQAESGLSLGLGTWVRQPFDLVIRGKSVILQDRVAYQVEISREIKWMEVFVKWYKIESFSELSIGVGITRGYPFYRKKKHLLRPNE